MVKKVFKWVGIGLGVFVGLIVIAAIALTVAANGKLSKTYSIQVEAVAIPTDAASAARGKRLAGALCAGCHGADLSGTAFFNSPGIGIINAENLTRGKGGLGATYTDADWVRALRHGVGTEGTSVLIMPANDFYYLSDGDLGDLVAYLKSVPPVDKEWSEPSLTLMGKLLVGAGMLDSSIIANQINHTAPRPAAPAPGMTVGYGDYLVRIHGFRTCHGQQLSGGKDPNPDVKVIGQNLTPGGELAAWSDADFIKTIRSGVTPSNHQLNEAMPWKDYNQVSDDELKAILLYLKSLPKLATTQ